MAKSRYFATSLSAFVLAGVLFCQTAPLLAAPAPLPTLISAPYLDKGLALLSQQRLARLGLKTKLVEESLQAMKVYRLQVQGQRNKLQLSQLQQRLAKVGYVFQFPVAAAPAVAAAPVKPVVPPVAAKTPPVPAAPPQPVAVAVKPASPPLPLPMKQGSAPPALPLMQGDPLAFAPQPPKPLIKRFLAFPLQLVDRLLARLTGVPDTVAAVPAPRPASAPVIGLRAAPERPAFQPEPDAPRVDRQALRLTKTAPPHDEWAEPEAAEEDYVPVPSRTYAQAPSPAEKSAIKMATPQEESLDCQLARMATDLQREGFDVSSTAGCSAPVGYLVALYDDQDEATEMAQELRAEDYEVVMVNRPDGKVEVRIDDTLLKGNAAQARPSPSKSVRGVQKAPSRSDSLGRLEEAESTPGESTFSMEPEGSSRTGARENDSLSSLLKEAPQPTARAAAPPEEESPNLEHLYQPPTRATAPQTGWNPEAAWQPAAPAPVMEEPAPVYAQAPWRRSTSPQARPVTALDPILARLPPSAPPSQESRPLERPEPAGEAAPVMKRFYPARPSFVPSRPQSEGSYRPSAPAAPAPSEDIFDLLY